MSALDFRPDRTLSAISRRLSASSFFRHPRIRPSALVIPKGGIENAHAHGLPAFRERIVGLAPSFAHRVEELQSWDDVKLLSVTVNRVREWWWPGLLLIGDAGHAISAVGGIGINLAVQDAVAASNILAQPLRQGAAGPEILRPVQRRRNPGPVDPASASVRPELRVLGAQRTPRAPLALCLLQDMPRLRRLPAWLVGHG